MIKRRVSIKAAWKRRLTRARHRLSELLLLASLRLDPRISKNKGLLLNGGEYLKLLSITRLEHEELNKGEVRIKYTATDPMWTHNGAENAELIELRRHITRLCLSVNDFCNWHSLPGWKAVRESLHLAASLDDLHAYTDIDGTSMWCGSAADYESANSEVAAKHLAGVFFFILVWTSYEGMIDIASIRFPFKQQKGAKGREIVNLIRRDNSFPHLKTTLLQALHECDHASTDFSTPEMRRMLKNQSIAGIAAEYIRVFRNALIHGDVSKPEPEDWGAGSKYQVNEDPAIKQFRWKTRLTLMLIQMMMIAVSEPTDSIESWLSEPASAHDVLRTLHCESSSEMPLLPSIQELPDFDADRIQSLFDLSQLL